MSQKVACWKYLYIMVFIWYIIGILAYDKKATADRWWNSASNIVKEDFGRQCFIPEFKIANHESNTTPDLSSIVDTISHAVSVKTPKPFYYSGFLAKTLPFAYTVLPPVLREPVMKLIADWFVFKPTALQTDKPEAHVKSLWYIIDIPVYSVVVIIILFCDNHLFTYRLILFKLL